MHLLFQRIPDGSCFMVFLSQELRVIDFVWLIGIFCTEISLQQVREGMRNDLVTAIAEQVDCLVIDMVVLDVGRLTI